jgi:hypothetical protein
MNEPAFKQTIINILNGEYGPARGDQVFQQSPLVQYIAIKTRSANRGSKARGSFANLYAIYVLVEDYINGDFAETGTYAEYDGARFSKLFQRQRELPFGERLQNHALNSRLNEEFRKYFPTSEYVPILRNLETNRYWINEGLLRVSPLGAPEVNISAAVLSIIDAYVAAKRDAFQQFLDSCRRLADIEDAEATEGIAFVESLLAPTVDARIFEIVSFAILHSYYAAQSIWIGPIQDEVEEQPLVLYKTGRTNANDGGIDYVMRPLGRFYQVTETLDVRKYFLDIDKVQRFPITFVVKSELATEALAASIRQYAEKAFTAHAVVEAYMNAVEEIINITMMKERLRDVVARGEFGTVLSEIVTQAKVEFYLYEDAASITDAGDA